MKYYHLLKSSPTTLRAASVKRVIFCFMCGILETDGAMALAKGQGILCWGRNTHKDIVIIFM